jgi:dipeptidyl aminopeptidase/acylaminoacyl peptidase
VLAVLAVAAVTPVGVWWFANPEPQAPVLRAASLRFVPAPRGLDILSLEWDPFQRRLLASATALGTTRIKTHLFELAGAGRSLEVVGTANDPACISTEQLDPQPLRDGRIVYLQICHSDQLEPSKLYSVWVHDQMTHSTVRFRPYPVHLWSTALAVTADGGAALIAGDSLSYAHVYALGTTRLRRLSAPVSFARDIAWTSDGRRFAVGGVPSWHRDGWDIFVAHPWRIYIGDRAGTRHRELPLHLTSETAISWAPNGRWLAFVSSPAGQRRGLWAIEVATGKMMLLVADKDLKSPTWLPDGRLLALRFAPSIGSRNGYYVIPRSSLHAHGIPGP